MLRHQPIASEDQQSRTGEPPGWNLEALLVASARGDAAAFMQLYDRAAPGLYGFVLRILRDDRRSEDVIALVFAELWRASIGFDPRLGSARAWMTAIAASRIRAELTGRGGERSSVASEPA
jgi:RNA polymerase sigma-70 factor, ECF subfamily